MHRHAVGPAHKCRHGRLLLIDKTTSQVVTLQELKATTSPLLYNNIPLKRPVHVTGKQRQVLGKTLMVLRHCGRLWLMDAGLHQVRCLHLTLANRTPGV